MATLGTQFWHFTRLVSRRDYGTPTDWECERETESVSCPVTASHNIVREVSHGPLRVRYGSAKVPDIFWPYLRGEFIVRDSVLRRFEEAQLTGFEAKPVADAEMPRAEKQRLVVPKLWEIVVTGWAGEVPAKAGVRMTYSCAGCGHTRYTIPSEPDLLSRSS
ncbi:MAG: hypothetical protein GTO63_33395 [Anaerolineae bacterium]|nr:hypothetical protein [Anaerolineae bacterium]NIN99545.1 hypothetical protein [Anaerolineae bacterium]NIQ82405.1 hypothetical protein [Anaerolineae bacterium]